MRYRERTVRRLLPTAAATLVLAGLVAGCSSTAAGHDSTSTSTTTVPTTTIPSAVVPGTTESGSLAFLGSVRRVPVMPVPAGDDSTVVPAPGTAAYRDVVTVAYRQFGAGRPLLLIPGEDATMSWWPPAFLSDLAAHFRVTIFDLPDTGYSGPEPSEETLASLADVTAGLVSELGLVRPLVAGWGLGGQVALLLATRHRHLAPALVLLDTGLPIAGAVGEGRVARRLLSSLSVTPVTFAALALSSVGARTTWLDTLDSEIPDVCTTSGIAAEAGLEALVWRERDFARKLGSLKLSVLLVVGSDDAVFPEKDSSSLRAALAHSKLEVVNGAGYLSFSNDASQVAAAVATFSG